MTSVIYSDILVSTKEAMKAKDKNLVEALRLISNEIKMHAIDNRIELPPEDSISINIMTKMVKQRKDAIDQFENANRPELAEKEKYQLEVIRKFLPNQLSPDETKELVAAKIKEMNLSSMADIGKLMQEIKKEPAGTIDLSLVSKLAKEMIT
jgi:uncharacterized protein YqeY